MLIRSAFRHEIFSAAELSSIKLKEIHQNDIYYKVLHFVLAISSRSLPAMVMLGQGFYHVQTGPMSKPQVCRSMVSTVTVGLMSRMSRPVRTPALKQHCPRIVL